MSFKTPFNINFNTPIVECRALVFSLNLCGAIFDSCPGPISVVPYAAQTFGTSSLHDRPLLFYPFPMLAGTFGYFQYSLNKESLMTSIQHSLRLFPQSRKNYNLHGGAPEWPGCHLRSENESWPLLFLYTKTDDLMPYSYIKRLIALKEKQNPSRHIVSKLFDKARHVTIMPKYPEQYKSEIARFLTEIRRGK